MKNDLSLYLLLVAKSLILAGCSEPAENNSTLQVFGRILVDAFRKGNKEKALILKSLLIMPVYVGIMITLSSCQIDSQNTTFISEIVMGNLTSKCILKIKDNRARLDMPDQNISAIITPDGKRAILNHQQKMVAYLNLETLSKETLSQDDFSEFKEALQFKFSGKKQNILGWDCAEYILINGTMVRNSRPAHIRMTAWIATNYPDGQRLQTIIEKSYDDQFSKHVFGRQFAMPGFAIKTEAVINNSALFTSQIIAISNEGIPDSTFAIPVNYATSIAK